MSALRARHAAAACAAPRRRTFVHARRAMRAGRRVHALRSVIDAAADARRTCSTISYADEDVGQDVSFAIVVGDPAGMFLINEYIVTVGLADRAGLRLGVQQLATAHATARARDTCSSIST